MVCNFNVKSDVSSLKTHFLNTYPSNSEYILGVGDEEMDFGDAGIYISSYSCLLFTFADISHWIDTKLFLI